MRAVVFHGAGDVRVESVGDPRVEAPSDAVVRVLAAGVCGSDLWYYRGLDPLEAGARLGHEFVGVVEDTGPQVSGIGAGDVVVAPFMYSDGDCPACRRGLPTSCPQGGIWGGGPNPGGAQAEAIRVPHASANLVRLPVDAGSDPATLDRFLPLADVLPTGHHAAVCGGVGPGSDVVVVGDGPVGLCAVLAARRLGAERVLVLGHHEARLALAASLGATDTAVTDAPADVVRDRFGDAAPVVLECVGTQTAVDQALACVRDGGTLAYVGLPVAGASVELLTTFDRNITIRGGVAPAGAYIPDLLGDVERGALDASAVLDLAVSLDEAPQAYEAMHRRDAVKAVIRP